jgi:hypothetical protein
LAGAGRGALRHAGDDRVVIEIIEGAQDREVQVAHAANCERRPPVRLYGPRGRAVLADRGVSRIIGRGAAGQAAAFLGIASVTDVLEAILVAALVIIACLDALVVSQTRVLGFRV